MLHRENISEILVRFTVLFFFSAHSYEAVFVNYFVINILFYEFIYGAKTATGKL